MEPGRNDVSERRLRVVPDPDISSGVVWRHYDGRLECGWPATHGLFWHPSPAIVPNAERVAMWADLLANPYEEEG
jgi:hypothetical protein